MLSRIMITLQGTGGEWAPWPWLGDPSCPESDDGHTWTKNGYGSENFYESYKSLPHDSLMTVAISANCLHPES